MRIDVRMRYLTGRYGPIHTGVAYMLWEQGTDVVTMCELRLPVPYTATVWNDLADVPTCGECADLEIMELAREAGRKLVDFFSYYPN